MSPAHKPALCHDSLMLEVVRCSPCSVCTEAHNVLFNYLEKERRKDKDICHAANSLVNYRQGLGQKYEQRCLSGHHTRVSTSRLCQVRSGVFKTVRPPDHNLARNVRELRGVYYTATTTLRLSETSTGVDFPLPFWSRGCWAQQGPNGCSVASDGLRNRYRNKGAILSGRVIRNTKPGPAKDQYIIPLPRWLVATKIDSAARRFAWFATVVKFKISHLSSR